MDYPKSVPGIGLLNGKFVDENPVAGTPGSLIPAAWGNSITQELLTVIGRAGLVPDEADTAQLLKALQVMLANASPMLSRVLQINHSRSLAAQDLGLVMVNGAQEPITLTLPAADSVLGVRDVIVRRLDNGGNRILVQCTGADTIKFHTHLRAAGYGFLVLMGAGDFWHLRSDGAGGWWPVGRYDNAALGRMFFETTTQFSPGGYGALNGKLLNRADWPWLWDHAKQSGMLRPDNDRAGGWSYGDGVSTFRLPEAQGEFLRVLDEDRGVDVGRGAGSWQTGTNITGDNGQAPAVHGIGEMAKVGVDPTSFNGMIYYNFAANTEVISSVFWGMVRPRNIAYPGRIKLI
ncbi:MULTISPECIES: phage tail protein [Pseudomonas]|uniref:Phage tail protein n=1 Tax=Pseudomonas piscis TaxID=2614538 RepID=A0ABY9NKQ1_9PSED|nr:MULTISPECIES: phage tail protein [Pseudomonas]POA58731.1 phage tail protein [Pseudomonas sp. FW507-12TSA]WMN19011.1 phage tail protein [Pseudomonas piscis]